MSLPASNTNTTTVTAQTSPARKSPEKSKKIVQRRRRRARARDDLDDDEEIERDALSGTESEPMTSGTETDSEEETEENVPTPQSTAATKPPATSDAATSSTNQNSTAGLLASNQGEKEKSTPMWSEMMQDDLLDPNDPTLPVVDFADLSVHVASLSVASPDPPTSQTAKGKAKQPKGAKGAAKKNAQATESKEVQDKSTDAPAKTTPREAYLHRLNTDPSFVPVVGQFWSHDDRLLNKDLRGMSDWWKGRWSGRGRRGGSSGRGGFSGSTRGNVSNGHGEPRNPPNPVEEQWSHDGFEELAKLEDAKKAGRGGRGSIRVRPTRGWFKGARGGRSIPRQEGPRQRRSTVKDSQPAVPAQPSETSTSGETKQNGNASAEAQAPSDPPAGAGPPPKPSVVRSSSLPQEPPKSGPSTQPTKPQTQTRPKQPKRAAKSSDGLSSKPGPVEQAQPGSANPTSAAAGVPTASGAPVSPVNPPESAKPTRAKHRSNTSTSNLPKPGGGAVHQVKPSDPGSAGPRTNGENSIQTPTGTQVETPSNGNTAQDVQPGAAKPLPPVSIPPIVTAAAPGPYGSQYSYAALPPGIAMGESGMLYEIATGRPVILNQSTPPPATAPVPMYNPRPVPHSHLGHRLSSGSVSYIPPHLHPSMTPDFRTPPPVLPPAHPRYPQDGYVYGPGTPREGARATPTFFAPPRQSGRLEIKAPGSNLPTGTPSSTREGAAPGTTNVSEKPSSSQASPTHPTYSANMVYPPTDPYYGAGGYYPPDPQSHPGAHPQTEEQHPYPTMYGAYYHPQQYPQGYQPYPEVPPDGGYNPYATAPGQAPVYY